MFLSRRDFAKIAGCGIGALMLTPVTQIGEVLASSSLPASVGSEKAMLYDASKCIGCGRCSIVCKQCNQLPIESDDRGGDSINGLSEKTWTMIKRTEFNENGKHRTLFHKLQCMHCTEASCKAVCPTGAIFHQSEAVVIDQNRCIGCGYCVQACPFGVPHMCEEEGTVRKCTLCIERTTQGFKPTCVEACPVEAIIYADRAEIIADGKRRVQTLIANGMKNTNLYGDAELGGLGVMNVLLESPSVYGLPETPRLVTKNAAPQWISGIITAGVIAVLPFWFIFRRRERLKQETDKTRSE